MKPTVGRIVHFHDDKHAAPYGPGPFAAIVMAVSPAGGGFTLWVLFPAPGSPREITNVTDDRATGVYWAWPPQV